MSSENFYDDWVTNNKKKEIKYNEESRLILSEYSKEGCNYCLQNGSKCNVHHGKLAKNINPLLTNIIRNPSIILGDPKKLLIDNGFDIPREHVHVNTCIWNYTHNQCQNCVDGRFKEIKWTDPNGKIIDLKFCFPVLKNNNVLPIGLHWDVDITVKNNEILKDKLFIKIYDGNNKYLEKKPEKVCKIIKEKDSIDITSVGSTSDDISLKNEESYPELNTNINFKENKTVWDNIKDSKIKKSDNMKINKINETKNIEINDNSKNDNLNNEVNILTKENQDLLKLVNEQKNQIISLKKALSYDNNSINESKENIDKITIDLHKYKEKSIKLESENLKLKRNLSDTEKKKNLSETDIQNITKATKHFSNILFESIVNNHYSV